MFNHEMLIIQKPAGPLDPRTLNGTARSIEFLWHRLNTWTGDIRTTTVRPPISNQNDQNSDSECIAKFPVLTVLLYKRSALRVTSYGPEVSAGWNTSYNVHACVFMHVPAQIENTSARCDRCVLYIYAPQPPIWLQFFILWHARGDLKVASVRDSTSVSDCNWDLSCAGIWWAG